jgi:hypothetical protein
LYRELIAPSLTDGTRFAQIAKAEIEQKIVSITTVSGLNVAWRR